MKLVLKHVDLLFILRFKATEHSRNVDAIFHSDHWEADLLCYFLISNITVTPGKG